MTRQRDDDARRNRGGLAEQLRRLTWVEDLKRERVELPKLGSRADG